MFFKKSKKKQLAEIKYQLFLLRAGLMVQKEHSVHLVDAYGNKENFAETIEKLYDYVIAKVIEIEAIK